MGTGISADQGKSKTRKLRTEEEDPPFQKPNPKRWGTLEETKSKSSRRVRGGPPAFRNIDLEITINGFLRIGTKNDAIGTAKTRNHCHDSPTFLP
jgi:hypothetical protein